MIRIIKKAMFSLTLSQVATLKPITIPNASLPFAQGCGLFVAKSICSLPFKFWKSTLLAEREFTIGR